MLLQLPWSLPRSANLAPFLVKSRLAYFVCRVNSDVVAFMQLEDVLWSCVLFLRRCRLVIEKVTLVVTFDNLTLTTLWLCLIISRLAFLVEEKSIKAFHRSVSAPRRILHFPLGLQNEDIIEGKAGGL